ncbi:phosphoribosyltransferase domain-containing protein [Streptomyces sp. SCSIO 30461]|uniref:phosphoribosyltransferase n=1 Tax=Streptomyces sp. SCSIO 30461 TaxID=3118085 RepID=UPI0030CB01F6
MTTRIFENHRVWQLAQDDFLTAACLIAAQEAEHAPAAVLGIARGGVPLAEIVAEQLGVPAVAVRARHNEPEGIRQAATGRVLLDHEHNQDAFASLPASARLLVVDDICGSGATLRAVEDVLAATVSPSEVRTAVLCRNEGSQYPLDIWGWDVADWVHFPWEPEPQSGRIEALPPLTGLRSHSKPPGTRA